MIWLVPRLIYHTEEKLLYKLEITSPKHMKREPVTALTLSILLGSSLAGLGTGTASLIMQTQHYSSLHAAIDIDTEKVRKLYLPSSVISDILS